MLSPTTITRLCLVTRKGRHLAHITLARTCKAFYRPHNIQYTIVRPYIACQRENCRFDHGKLYAAQQQLPNIQQIFPSKLGHSPGPIPGPVGTQHQQWFHTSGRRSAFPPIIWAAINIVGRLTAVLVPRYLRKKWLKKQPEHLRQKYHNLMLKVVLGALALFSVVGSIYYYCHIQEAPITKRKRFISLTQDQYLKVADFETDSYLEKYKTALLPATSDYYSRVIGVAQRLVQANQDIPGMDSQKWVIHVIEDETRNAFVLPNGHVFVFTGLLDFVQNDDQLAVVIAHEMAHAILLHAAENLSYNQLVDQLVILVMAAIWTVMMNDGIALITNWFYSEFLKLTVHFPYSRELELEADTVGLQFAAKACFDVREGSVFWMRMGIKDDFTGDKTPEWLSTHPSSDKRVQKFDQLLPKAIALMEECKCPRLPDSDPRVLARQHRHVANEVMVATATKANLSRVQRLDQKSVMPSINPFHVGHQVDGDKK